MSDSAAQGQGAAETFEKGKGKQPTEDVSMDEAGDDEEDTSDDEIDEVSRFQINVI